MQNHYRRWNFISGATVPSGDLPPDDLGTYVHESSLTKQDLEDLKNADAAEDDSGETSNKRDEVPDKEGDSQTRLVVLDQVYQATVIR